MIDFLKLSGEALRQTVLAVDFLRERSEGSFVRFKENDEVVSDLDLAIQSRLVEGIRSFSDLPIVAEENTPGVQSSPPEEGLFWALDPIDGTVNYVAGLPLYAVSLGLCRADKGRLEFLAGVVGAPETKEVWFTQGTERALVSGRRISPMEAELRDALLVLAFGREPAGERGVNPFRVYEQIHRASRGCLRLGSASIGVARVAEGRINGAVGINTSIWDVAGALAVARAAGCSVHLDWRPGSAKLSYVVGPPVLAGALSEFLGLRGGAND